jgi:hypothetical protein
MIGNKRLNTIALFSSKAAMDVYQDISLCEWNIYLLFRKSSPNIIKFFLKEVLKNYHFYDNALILFKIHALSSRTFA